jgi:V-type H+-transporting ATPase subunit C
MRYEQEVIALDNDIKNKYSAYQNIKTSLTAVQRKSAGNLSTKSLAPLLKKDDFVLESEYLETLLVVVPKILQKNWLKGYETLAPRLGRPPVFTENR